MNVSPFRWCVHVGCAGLMAAWLLVSPVVNAQQVSTGKAENFPGVGKVLTPEQFEASGMSKLSPDERKKLDDYLRGYFAGATERVVQTAVAKATTIAVDQAVKENKIKPPDVIQSRIPGPVSGWKSGKIFVLENGQHWKIADNGERHFAILQDPDVFITRDFMSYKMTVAEGGVARVIRVK